MLRGENLEGFFSLLSGYGSKPLLIWDQKVRNGHIRRVMDKEMRAMVLEIEGSNARTTHITCPTDPEKTLGIQFPFLYMIIKNLNKYFTFEIQVLDDQNTRRRFRVSTFQSCPKVNQFNCAIPMVLNNGWNEIHLNLSDLTQRIYGTNYIETLRIQIHANCRIRHVYFSHRILSDDEGPEVYRLCHLPA